MSARRLAWRTAVGLAGVALPASASLAELKTVPSLSVSAGGAYSTNPFLLAGDNTDAASVQVDIRPQLEFLDDTTSGVLSANYNRSEYLSKFSGNDGYGVAASGRKQFDPRTTLDIAAAYDSQVLGAGGAFDPPRFTGTQVTGGTTGTGTGTTGTGTGLPTGTITNPIGTSPVDTIGGDIGLFGLRQRRNAVSASANLTYLPSARATWSFGVNASRNSYPNAAQFADDFSQFGGTASYSRQLNERTSIGLQASASVIDYQNFGSSRIYTPRVTLNRQLSPLWSLEAALGASIIDAARTRATVSAEATLCRQQARGNLCISAAREPNVSGFGGVRTSTSGSISYSRRLSEKLSMGASANYSHVDDSSFNVVPGFNNFGDQDFWSADVNVQRQVARRLSVYASAAYRDVSGFGQDIKGDFGGRVGLSLTIGGRQ